MKAKISKTQAPKVVANNNLEIQAGLDKDFYQAEIKQLKDKLNERDITIRDLQTNLEKKNLEFDDFKKSSTTKTTGKYILI